MYDYEQSSTGDTLHIIACKRNVFETHFPVVVLLIATFFAALSLSFIPYINWAGWLVSGGIVFTWGVGVFIVYGVLHAVEMCLDKERIILTNYLGTKREIRRVDYRNRLQCSISRNGKVLSIRIPGSLATSFIQIRDNKLDKQLLVRRIDQWNEELPA